MSDTSMSVVGRPTHRRRSDMVPREYWTLKCGKRTDSSNVIGKSPVAVGHPSEIEEIFDSISYSKGASIIRMLHDFIGDDSFKKGMHSYLTKYSHKNTQTEDLWCSLEEASGKPITKIMSTFTLRMGFPVIKVSSKMDGATRVLTVQQSKFNADGSPPDPTFQWVVPYYIQPWEFQEVLPNTSDEIEALSNSLSLLRIEYTVRKRAGLSKVEGYTKEIEELKTAGREREVLKDNQEKQELEDVLLENAKLTNDVEYYTKQLSEPITKLEQMVSINTELSETISKLRKEVADAELAVNSRQTDLTTSRDQVEQEKYTVNELEFLLSEANKRETELQVQIPRLESNPAVDKDSD
ncbi:Puromycin-sensitive aminopeptidase-like isoform X2 [Oopsacas minuta]|uniref:Puromycin-sensitive aminopeptidase-like isoform X2 n=1 Tax=Oopsacas minuta TaxID=111878 RepID=A0AAV7JGU4_9METZ|nr:Puromycin-sensitive aminopeptidase-like isoform X2 [Oopsacas minuta]